MKKQVKKSKRGGWRPGAGRKETGRTTTTISFSVPFAHEATIRKLVKDKLLELKKEVMPNIRMEGVLIPKPLKDEKGKSVSVKSGSNYLAKRRNSKLGIKD